MPASSPDAGASTDNPLRASKEQAFENSLGMKFVPVPGTDVLFCIHETRWKDYAVYAAEVEGVDGGSRSQTHDGFTPTDRPEDHPVTRVSWEDAQAFCAWLSEKEGRTYRLPTDREWSVAVGLGRLERPRSGDTPESLSGKVADEFPWGKGWPAPEGAGNYSDASRQAKAPRADARYVEGGYDEGFPTTAPVMSFAATSSVSTTQGAMYGEWCEDRVNISNEQRVLRGELSARADLHSGFARMRTLRVVAVWNNNERGNARRDSAWVGRSEERMATPAAICSRPMIPASRALQ